MNKYVYNVLYVIQRIINLPTLWILIPIGFIGSIFYGIYLSKWKNMSTMEAMLHTQQKASQLMVSLYFQVKIKDATFNLNHVGIMFWIVLLWFLI